MLQAWKFPLAPGYEDRYACSGTLLFDSKSWRWDWEGVIDYLRILYSFMIAKLVRL